MRFRRNRNAVLDVFENGVHLLSLMGSRLATTPNRNPSLKVPETRDQLQAQFGN